MNVFTHRTAGQALLSALSVTYYYVEIIDPSQTSRAVVERKKFYTRQKAENFVKRQKKFDYFNKYEVIAYKT